MTESITDLKEAISQLEDTITKLTTTKNHEKLEKAHKQLEMMHKTFERKLNLQIKENQEIMDENCEDIIKIRKEIDNKQEFYVKKVNSLKKTILRVENDTKEERDSIKEAHKVLKK